MTAGRCAITVDGKLRATRRRSRSKRAWYGDAGEIFFYGGGSISRKRMTAMAASLRLEKVCAGRRDQMALGRSMPAAVGLPTACGTQDKEATRQGSLQSDRLEWVFDFCDWKVFQVRVRMHVLD